MRAAACTALLILATITSGGAQAPAAPPQGDQPQAVFRSSTRLVVQNVYVKDKDGQPIQGLTAKDFVVFEDNQRQEIAFVEFQRIANEPVADVQATIPDPVRDAAAGVQRAVNVEISTPPTASVKYQNRRLLVLYFDQSSMPLTDQLRSYENARKFLDRQMASPTWVAVMSFRQPTSCACGRDFTDNRAMLREVLDGMQIGDDINGDGITCIRDSGGDAEFSVFNTDRHLSALQSAVNMYRALPESEDTHLLSGAVCG
jgi:VWFA-related protein